MKDIKRKYKGYWTKERCMEEAKKYNKIIDWQKSSSSSYATARRKKWLNECIEHILFYKNFWTKEKCIEEAKKYKYKSEWYKNSPISYNKAKKLDCINECSIHMKIWKNKGYWTKEKCIEEAKKYKYKSEWQKNSPSSYKKASDLGLLNELSIHMILKRKPKNFWTKEMCIEEAKKYETTKKWQNLSSSYAIAVKNGWLGDCNIYLHNKIKSHGYWTKERCTEEAKKYIYKSEWAKKNNTSYQTSLKNGWHFELTKHMKNVGNTKLRLIYAFEFPDKSVYVGLTYNSEQRKNWHFNNEKSQVFKHIKKRGLQPEFKELTEYHDKDIAAIKEGEFLKKYRLLKWNILNKVKTGGLGGNIRFWTKEKCMKEAKKYYTINEWRKKSFSSYSAALRHNYLKECVFHMEKYRYKFWTLEKCLEEAKKFTTIKDFRKKLMTPYRIIYENKWTDICFSHMTRNRKPNKYWTLEKCQSEALKYNTIKELNKNSSGAYHAIHKNKWQNMCLSHFKNQ